MYILFMIITGIVAVTPVINIISKKNYWPESTRKDKLILLFFILSGIFGFIYSCKKYNQDEFEQKLSSKVGELNGTKSKISYPMVGIRGDRPLPITYPDGAILLSKGGPLFRVYVVDGKIHYSGVLHDNKGTPLVRINGNEWNVLTDDYEYNQDDTGFEIVTKGDEKVFFNIEYENGVVWLSGCFIDEDGFGAKFEKIGGRLALIAINPNSSKSDLYVKNAQPLFIYPRQTHLGERR